MKSEQKEVIRIIGTTEELRKLRECIENAHQVTDERWDMELEDGTEIEVVIRD